MKLVKFEAKAGVNTYDVEFVCSSRDTRHGFAHDVTMFFGNVQINNATCHYLNRTWESWGYQTACLNAVNNELEDRKARLKAWYKDENAIQRMTKKHSEKLNEIYASDGQIALLNSIKETLKTRSF